MCFWAWFVVTNIWQSCGFFFSLYEWDFKRWYGQETSNEVLEMRDPKRSSWPLPQKHALGIICPALTPQWPILDVPAVSGMHWRDGWLGTGHRVAAQNGHSRLASGAIAFTTWGWRVSSSLDWYLRLGSHFRLLKSELLVFEASFIWLISCSCIQQILVEHLLCASAKDHKQALHSLQAPITVAGRWTVTHRALQGF